MTVGYSSPEDVINAALREAGYPRAIGEIYEGSRASRVALEVYGPTRDALLQEQDWDFALQVADLLAADGGLVEFGFEFVYTYPSHALRIRQVFPTPVPGTNNDPQPVRWVTGNDASLATKVIWTNVGVARASYIAQVIDPTQWNPGFTRAFVGRLAAIFAAALSDDINRVQLTSQKGERRVLEGAASGDSMSPVTPEVMRAAAAARG